MHLTAAGPAESEEGEAAVIENPLYSKESSMHFSTVDQQVRIPNLCMAGRPIKSLSSNNRLVIDERA